MKGDFARTAYAGRVRRNGALPKRYDGVLMQQGRVQLDADWNELIDAIHHRWRVQTIDTIGRAGAPVHDRGFVVQAGADGSLALTPGRLYVDGLLCELETADGGPLGYLSQPFLPAPEPLGLSGVAPGASRTDLIYLDVWLRHVSYLEDQGLLEPALGGPDTATRVQTVWQVRLVKNVGAGTACDDVPATYTTATAPGDGRLTTELVPAAGNDDPCIVPPESGYTGLENHLYRVEILRGGGLEGGGGTAATFTWSRDNASFGARIDGFVEGPTGEVHVIRLRGLGPDAVSRFRRDQWVEALGDASEFTAGRGTLAKIVAVNPADQSIEVEQNVIAHRDEANPRVRAWDVPAAGAMAVAAGPTALEYGIQVRFAGTTFRPGDYWTFAARTMGDQPVELFAGAAPEGIRHHYCRLGLVTWTRRADGTLETPQVEICVPEFPPLTELPEGGGCCIRLDAGADLGRRLQEALDDLVETGGCVCLPAGAHVLDRPITIRGARITLCGCGGLSHLIYAPGEATPAPAITIGDPEVGTHAIALRGFSLYAAGAPALVAVGRARRVDVDECWLVNLPGAHRLSACVVAGSVAGLTLRRCNLLGDVAVRGAEAKGTAEFRKLTAIAGVALDRCRVRARLAGAYLQRVAGLRVEACEIAGLDDGDWKELADGAVSLAPAAVPAFDRALHRVFYGGRLGPALQVAVSAVTATRLEVARSDVRARVGVLAAMVRGVEVRENRVGGAIGVLAYNSLGVAVTANELAAQELGVAATGVAHDWQIRRNRVTARRGVLFAAGDEGAAAVGGLFRAFLDAEAARAAAAPADAGVAAEVRAATGEAGRAMVREAGVGRSGRAVTVAVEGNTIAAADVGIAIADDVRSDDVRVAGNSLAQCRIAGIRLHGRAGASGEATGPQRFTLPAAAGHLVEGNRLRVSGVGISVESAGAAVTGNHVAVAGRTGRGVKGETIDGMYTASRAGAYAVGAVESGDARLVRAGLEDVTYRVAGGDLSRGDVEALARHLEGPLATEFGRVGLAGERALAREAAGALKAGDHARAAAVLREVGEAVVSVVGNAAIRLAAGHTAAAGNTVRGQSGARGGILVDAPSGRQSGKIALRAVAVRDNDVLGGSAHGIEVRVSVQGMRVEGNRVADAAGSGIAVAGGRDVGVLDNAVEQAAARDATAPPAIAVASAADVAVRGNAAGAQSGIRLAGCTGCVQVADNRVTANAGRALEATVRDGRLAVTGNCFEGARGAGAKGRPYLVAAAARDAILSHNHVAYQAGKGDFAVRLDAERAALLGNVWDERGGTLALALNATVYTQVGNVSTADAFEVIDLPMRSSENNVPRLDRKVGLVPAAVDFGGLVAVRGGGQ